jgi:uncharacterized protein (DUF1697 family)
VRENRLVATFAALLRAINLGATNKIPMAGLRSLFSDLGYADVATYVQSGNVVFRAPAGSADQVAAEIQRGIAEEFGLTVAVLLRTPAELGKITRANPFLGDESDPKKLHVIFLDTQPAAAAKRELDPERSPGDRFDLRGREIYLHLPNGFGRSKLTIDYFERRLGATATGRNWTTVTKLAELTQS